MGYLNREDKTKEVLDESGFFHTGDLGKINETGNLFIIGRMKEIIVTAGGENVAPYPIENFIMKKLKKYISWSIVVGDGRKFLSLLITIKNVNTANEVPSKKIDPEVKKNL